MKITKQYNVGGSRGEFDYGTILHNGKKWIYVPNKHEMALSSDELRVVTAKLDKLNGEQPDG